MMKLPVSILPYNREKACAYAQAWAKKRNPAYLDFGDYGGDCTNFISQCLYAGSGVMDYTPVFGWYYNSSYNRAPAWTGVAYLSNYLLRSSLTSGPFAREIPQDLAQPGDVIQLRGKQGLYHSLFVMEKQDGRILVAAHDFDALYRPLASYRPADFVLLHIEGVRSYQ